MKKIGSKEEGVKQIFGDENKGQIEILRWANNIFPSAIDSGYCMDNNKGI